MRQTRRLWMPSEHCKVLKKKVAAKHLPTRAASWSHPAPRAQPVHTRPWQTWPKGVRGRLMPLCKLRCAQCAMCWSCVAAPKQYQETDAPSWTPLRTRSVDRYIRNYEQSSSCHTIITPIMSLTYFHPSASYRRCAAGVPGHDASAAQSATHQKAPRSRTAAATRRLPIAALLSLRRMLARLLALLRLRAMLL